ncbi:MAG: hypothetical protein KF729_30815 [Sandaracinaceae bacterium]|nr:hypothetical protein [Sandaracinaceae bacterium]
MREPSEAAFVPVQQDRLFLLTPAVHRVERAAVAERAALARLLELADDLRADAVARLRERGASEAQVERYEAAFAGGRDAALAAGAALDAAVGHLAEVASAIAE